MCNTQSNHSCMELEQQKSKYPRNRFIFKLIVDSNAADVAYFTTHWSIVSVSTIVKILTSQLLINQNIS